VPCPGCHGFAASAAEGLIGLTPGVGDRLVGGLLREREDAGSRVHVVLDRRHAHHLRLGPPLRLGPRRRLRRHQLGGRFGQRRTERGHRYLAAAQALSQLRPELFVLLDQPV
jgi:hypothetical protein